ncbi:hypothetical protein SHKM778_22000 [Streptomyces sp. KM77-8]|uniref:Peptidase S8/S53 domain-containing protein n=1 Tax=Streptomyces haneummycinicus TaxID=3074435 RepID=A0AAT9HEJ5_9ACTN
MSPTKAALLATAVLLTALGPAQDAPQRLRLDGSGECTYPSKRQFKARPWPLQRVLLDELWEGTDKGKGVRVAVIDTGVDDKNPQLAGAVDKAAGLDLLTEGGGGDATTDEVGHGTKVAGIIAARPREGTGFVGLAPNATIIPVRQNDADSSGDSDSMARAIDHAVARGAGVINISQDTTKPLSNGSALAEAVRKAIAADVVVVASAGNDGLDGKVKKTYPAAFDGVLAVASSDRNNERAAFSQAGDFVGVAAPASTSSPRSPAAASAPTAAPASRPLRGGRRGPAQGEAPGLDHGPDRHPDRADGGTPGQRPRRLRRLGRGRSGPRRPGVRHRGSSVVAHARSRGAQGRGPGRGPVLPGGDPGGTRRTPRDLRAGHHRGPDHRHHRRGRDPARPAPAPCGRAGV